MGCKRKHQTWLRSNNVLWFNIQTKVKVGTKRSSLLRVEASLTKEKKSFMVWTTTTAAAAAVILINKTGVSICAFRQTGEKVKFLLKKIEIFFL
jgi:hypothetical protein